MPLLPEDPKMRRLTISQLLGFIGIPVVVVFALMIMLLATSMK